MRLREPKPTGRTCGNNIINSWPAKDYIRLPKPAYLPRVDFFYLLENRQSRRHFSEVSIESIAALFWTTLRHKATIGADENRVRTPIPTAGALASIRTLVIDPTLGAWIYDPHRHSAAVVHKHGAETVFALEATTEYTGARPGALLVFFADRKATEFYYDNPETLVLRDAGVVIGTMALACEPLDLAFCPLGTLGLQWIESILGVDKKVIIPGGAAALGRRQSATIT